MLLAVFLLLRLLLAAPTACCVFPILLVFLLLLLIWHLLPIFPQTFDSGLLRLLPGNIGALPPQERRIHRRPERLLSLLLDPLLLPLQYHLLGPRVSVHLGLPPDPFNPLFPLPLSLPRLLRGLVAPIVRLLGGLELGPLPPPQPLASRLVLQVLRLDDTVQVVARLFPHPALLGLNLLRALLPDKNVVEGWDGVRNVFHEGENHRFADELP
mmetsp:Transcript_9107/g.27293  ORF Transcript_9107/g.27293 Transcript_9107/m.27293 type:complete len:212 (+) Transcript_9107:596-1231(+)